MDVTVVGTNETHAQYKLNEFLQRVRRSVWAVEFSDNDPKIESVEDLEFGEIVGR